MTRRTRSRLMGRYPRGIRGDAGFEVLSTMSSHIEVHSP